LGGYRQAYALAMSTLPPDPRFQSLGLELLTAELRGKAQNDGELLKALAQRFKALLPTHTSVQHRRSLFGADQGVDGVTLELGDYQYRLHLERHRLLATSTHIVGGIALKTETLAFDAWLAQLLEAIESAATNDASMRQSLEKLARPAH
jgi:hypothetical protein